MAYDTTSAAFAEALRKLAAEDPAVAKAIADREQVEKYSGTYDQEWQDPNATGRLYGREGNEAWAYYDPATDSYKRVAADEKADLDKMYSYRNIHGDVVWGLKPAEGFHGYEHQGESMLGQGPDPYAGKTPQIPGPDTGTPVPSSPIDNPNYDPNDPIFAPGDGTGWFGDPGSGGGSGPGSGGPGGGGQANTSWDWAGMGGGQQNPPGWDYNPVDMSGFKMDYALGEDSPWGQQGVPGGNEDFYATQLNNLRLQKQHEGEATIQAHLRNKWAKEQAPQQQGDPWAWANQGKGLPQVQVGGSGAGQYALQQGITPGETSNADLIRRYGGDRSGEWLADNPNWETQYNWSRGSDPQALMNTLSPGLADHNRDYISKIYSQMFTGGNTTPEGGGPTAAPGYAMPIGSY